MEFKGNSNMSKDNSVEKHEFRKIDAKGSIVKRSGFDKIRDSFTEGDGESIKDYVVDKVLIPNIKNTAGNIIFGVLNTIDTSVRTAINMKLFNDPNHVQQAKSNSLTTNPTTYIQYGSMFDAANRVDNNSNQSYKQSSNLPEYGYLRVVDQQDIRNSYGKAEEAIDIMNEVIDRYGKLSIMEAYDITQQGVIPPATYGNYGWYSLNGYKIISEAGGAAIIKMPKVQPIKK